MKIIKTPSLLALAIFLILFGLASAFHINLGIVPGLAALVAGILILIGK